MLCTVTPHLATIHSVIDPQSSCHPSIPMVKWSRPGCLASGLHLRKLQCSVVTRSLLWSSLLASPKQWGSQQEKLQVAQISCSHPPSPGSSHTLPHCAWVMSWGPPLYSSPTGQQLPLVLPCLYFVSHPQTLPHIAAVTYQLTGLLRSHLGLVWWSSLNRGIESAGNSN